MKQTLACVLMVLTACGVEEAHRNVDRSGKPLPDELVGLDCEEPGWGYEAASDSQVYAAFDWDLGCDDDPWGDPGGGGGGGGGWDDGGGIDGKTCADQTKTVTRSGNGQSMADAQASAIWWAKEAAFQACINSAYTPFWSPWTTCAPTNSDDAGTTLGSCTVEGDTYWTCTATGSRTCHYQAE